MKRIYSHEVKIERATASYDRLANFADPGVIHMTSGFEAEIVVENVDDVFSIALNFWLTCIRTKVASLERFAISQALAAVERLVDVVNWDGSSTSASSLVKSDSNSHFCTYCDTKVSH